MNCKLYPLPSILGLALPFLALLLIASLTAGRAQAVTNVLFILDASGSMAGKVNGESKMDAAKTALSEYLSNLPEGQKAGLMIYGHRAKGDCQDVELAAPIGSPGFNFSEIKPLGKTPIGYALAQSASAFKNLAGQNNNVVLISDGIESCDADPCQAAAALAAQGIGMRVHVIGFALGPKEQEQLQCIADNGNGKYFSADSMEGLAEAINEAAQAAETAPPEPTPEPAPPPSPPAEQPRKVVFSDEFEGSDLSEDWDVTNPHPDAYVVEEGNLLAVSSTTGGVANPDIPNIFKLTKDLPSSDYTVTVKVNVKFATGAENFAVGLFDDKDNYLTAVLLGRVFPNSQGVDLKVIKASDGQATEFAKNVFDVDMGEPFDKAVKAVAQPITLKLVKEGHNFSASVNFAGQKDDAGNPVWVTTDAVTSLRPPKNLVVNLSQGHDVKGETEAKIDSITIDVPDEGAQ